MKKFFKHTITLVSEIILLAIAIGWCSAGTGDRYEPLALGVGALAGIIISIFCIFSKDDGKGGGGTNIFKTWFNFNSTVIQNNVSFDVNKLIEEQTAEDKERIKELKELLANNNQLHGIKLSKLIEQIADLEQQLKEKEAKIQEIVKYRETVGVNASPLFIEAYDLFSKGKIDEALNLLDEKKLNEAENKRKEDSAKERILKAQLQELTYDFQAAETNYLKAADIFPSYENNFQVARFYYKQNNFPAAETYYTRCLPLAKTPEEKANILHNVGVLHHNMKDYPKAAKDYEEALQIRRKLAATNPKAYRPKLADTLNNVGVLLWNMKDYPKAAKAYEEPLKIRRELADENPQAYRPDLAKTLNNLAVLHEVMKDYPKAAEAYEEALKIQRQLADENPQADLPYLALTLNNLGILHKDMKDYPKAKDAYEEALKIRRELAATNPQAYLPDLAMTLANLAIFYRKCVPDKEQSIQYANEIFSYRSSLEHIPNAHQYIEAALSVLIYWGQVGIPAGRIYFVH
ncbi:MAG: tetratricopeptide repeat protein [Tannerellaceae bacterium]|jgi:tetratricopeptide (TPR) repeat protein|nr:tetratricopeptide repeat protein [Tannerellaceae bacterium]